MQNSFKYKLPPLPVEALFTSRYDILLPVLWSLQAVRIHEIVCLTVQSQRKL